MLPTVVVNTMPPVRGPREQTSLMVALKAAVRNTGEDPHAKLARSRISYDDPSGTPLQAGAQAEGPIDSTWGVRVNVDLERLLQHREIG